MISKAYVHKHYCLKQVRIRIVLIDYKVDGYASRKNREYTVVEGIKNVVFNKIAKSMENIAVGESVEAALKRWRSGIESVISILNEVTS